MNIMEGDLIELALRGKFDVIIHGCNCFCSMGAGIAKVIKHEFPEAYQADLATKKGAKEKLGTYSKALIKRNGVKIVVVNAYTQFNWSGTAPIVDYDAIQNVFTQIKKDFQGKRIGYPLIGAGLAGGDWNIIEAIINNELEGENHTLVKLNV